MAVTRIKNNQITDSNVVAYSKITAGTITGNLFAPSVSINSDITVTGNLNIFGNTNTLNSVNTFINDPLVIFNNGYTGSLAGYDIGMLINRNLSSLASYGAVNTAWVWVENDQAFEAIATSTLGNAIGGSGGALTTKDFVNVKVGNLQANSVTLTSGTFTAPSGIQNTPIGTTTRNVGYFTTVFVETGFATANAVITGGSLNNTTVGMTTPTTGRFTYVTVDTGFGTANAQITGGNVTGLANLYANYGTVNTINSTTGNITNLSGSDSNYTYVYARNFTTANANIWGPTTTVGAPTVPILNAYVTTETAINFTSPNATITGSATTIGNATPISSIASGYLYAATGLATANAVITGGSLNNTTVGLATPLAGQFNNLTVTTVGTFTVANTQNSLQSVGTGAVQILGGASVSKDLYVAGNIYTSNLIATVSQTLVFEDPLVYLRANNVSSYNYEIGIYSNFVGGAGGNYQHSGVIRNHLDSQWYIVSNVVEPAAATIDFTLANLVYDPIKFGEANVANTTTATSSLTGALKVMGGAGIRGNIVAHEQIYFDITSIAIGASSSYVGNQGANAIAIGSQAGTVNQGISAVALGYQAGQTSQLGNAVAVGSQAGKASQGINATAIGVNAAVLGQGSSAVAVGDSAGQTSQGSTAIAIGQNAGQTSQKSGALAVGGSAGYTTQGNNAVALGTNAGYTSQAVNAVAIGNNAGYNQTASSVILNATGSQLNDGGRAGFIVDPVRNDVTIANIGQVTMYNTTTKEFTYSNNIAIAGNVAANSQAFFGSGSQFTANPLLNNPIVVVRGASPATPSLQYTQVALQNTNNTGSSDFISYGNNYSGYATSDHGWVDLGFTGDAFNDPAYGITQSNDGYVFASGANATVGGNLVFATDYTGGYNDIVFGVGSFYANSEVARFHGNLSNNGYLSLQNTTTVTSPTTGALRVAGGAGFNSNVQINLGANVNVSKTATTGDFYAKGRVDDSLLWVRADPTYDSVWIGGNTNVSDLNPGVKFGINSPNAMQLPVGTSAQRPGAPAVGGADVSGLLRYNSDTNGIEWYDGYNARWTSGGTVFTIITDFQFTGDGITTDFNLTQIPAITTTTAATLVSINGVVQIPTLAYAVVSDNIVRFTEPPIGGDVVDVRVMATSQVVSTVQSSNGLFAFTTDTAGAYVYTNGAVATYWAADGGQVSNIANVIVGSANSVTTLDYFGVTQYRTAKYIIQASSGTSFQSEETLVVHNGTTAYATTYALLQTAGNLGVVSATITGGNVLVQFTASNSNTYVRTKIDYMPI